MMRRILDWLENLVYRLMGHLPSSHPSLHGLRVEDLATADPEWFEQNRAGVPFMVALDDFLVRNPGHPYSVHLGGVLGHEGRP